MDDWVSEAVKRSLTRPFIHSLLDRVAHPLTSRPMIDTLFLLKLATNA
jgi:hypothetical protein